MCLWFNKSMLGRRTCSSSSRCSPVSGGRAPSASRLGLAGSSCSSRQSCSIVAQPLEVGRSLRVLVTAPDGALNFVGLHSDPP